jgi:tripartite-type tricarboxylate transporter receptor subunit TctC
MSSAAVVTNPVLSTVRYHPIRDFTPITQITRQPYILIVHPSVPANTAKDLIAWGKANPGKLNFASAGTGSLMHLTGELFKANAGVAMTHVPYKGMALAYPDLIAGQVQVGFPAIITALPHLKSGKVRGLGVTSRTRVASLPDIPSIQESGVPGFSVEQWYGVWAPAGTPAAAAARLHKEFATVVREPETVTRLTASGSEAVGNSSAEFAAHVKAESERWAKIVSQAGIKIQ